MLMLKTTVSSQVLIANKVLGANEVDGVESNDELIEKCEKLSKTGKLSKSQKLAKLRKKSSISGNLPNFDAKENKSSFLTSDARMTFNYLRLALIKTSILQYFDPEYHICIKTDVSGYTVNGVLSQLAFKTKPDKVVTKTALDQ